MFLHHLILFFHSFRLNNTYKFQYGLFMTTHLITLLVGGVTLGVRRRCRKLQRLLVHTLSIPLNGQIQSCIRNKAYFISGKYERRRLRGGSE